MFGRAERRRREEILELMAEADRLRENVPRRAFDVDREAASLAQDLHAVKPTAEHRRLDATGHHRLALTLTAMDEPGLAFAALERSQKLTAPDEVGYAGILADRARLLGQSGLGLAAAGQAQVAVLAARERAVRRATRDTAVELAHTFAVAADVQLV